MKEEFVTFEIAKNLKEKGFDEYCEYGHFLEGGQGILYTPTISQVLKWLREEKKLFVETSLFKYGYESYVQSTIFEEDKDYTNTWRVEGFHSTYEQAAIAGIEYVLNNLI